MMRAIIATAGLVAFGQTVLAEESDSRWVQGYGQGVIEATVTAGAGNRILVACDTSHRLTAMHVTIGGQTPTGDRLIFTFDDLDPASMFFPSGHLRSDNHAGADNFTSIIERLKRHGSVHVMTPKGDGARFTLAGSSAAIGECLADFYW